MNETPTPPENYRLIPRAYLEAGNPLPEDGLFICDGGEWVPSMYRGHTVGEIASLEDGDFYATAQPLPCFQSPDQGPEPHICAFCGRVPSLPTWCPTCVATLAGWVNGKPAPEPTAEQRIAETGDGFKIRVELCQQCHCHVSDWVEAEHFNGRICRPCERIAELERERDEARAERDTEQQYRKHAERRRDSYFVEMQRRGSEVDALRAQLAASEKDRQWQPIETAPKDGTGILLLENGVVIHAQWSDGFHNAWVCRGRIGFVDHATHWMPLQKAPDAAMKEAK